MSWSNQNCVDQSCSQYCCNRNGYCIDVYSSDTWINQCYYYYEYQSPSQYSNSTTTSMSPQISMIVFPIVGFISFFVVIAGGCCIYRYWKRRQLMANGQIANLGEQSQITPNPIVVGHSPAYNPSYAGGYPNSYPVTQPIYIQQPAYNQPIGYDNGNAQMYGGWQANNGQPFIGQNNCGYGYGY